MNKSLRPKTALRPEAGKLNTKIRGLNRSKMISIHKKILSSTIRGEYDGWNFDDNLSKSKNFENSFNVADKFVFSRRLSKQKIKETPSQKQRTQAHTKVGNYLVIK